MGQESAGSRIVKALLGLPASPPPPSQAEILYLRRKELESSFSQDFYFVRDARDVLADRGLDIHLGTLRRWIRAGKVKVTGPDRKQVIHKEELARLLLQERA